MPFRVFPAQQHAAEAWEGEAIVAASSAHGIKVYDGVTGAALNSGATIAVVNKKTPSKPETLALYRDPFTGAKRVVASHDRAISAFAVGVEETGALVSGVSTGNSTASVIRVVYTQEEPTVSEGPPAGRDDAHV
jgi:hypothetical protein